MGRHNNEGKAAERGAPPPPPRTTILEDRIAIQRREMDSLLLDNQRLASAHLALKQDLALAHSDLRHLSAAASAAKSDRDDQVRQVYQRLFKLEAEAVALDGVRAELAEVRADVHGLGLHREDLAADLRRVTEEVESARREAERVASVRAEIDSLHKEIQRGRAAIELEEKTLAHNLDHEREMEKNVALLLREIDRLRAQLANAENRASASANPSPPYLEGHGHPQVVYAAASYPDPCTVPQVQDGNRGLASFVPRAIPNGPPGVQQTEVQDGIRGVPSFVPGAIPNGGPGVPQTEVPYSSSVYNKHATKFPP